MVWISLPWKLKGRGFIVLSLGCSNYTCIVKCKIRFTFFYILLKYMCDARLTYSAFTETRATQTTKTNQTAEPKQQTSTLSNPANQISSTKQWNLNLFVVILTWLWCLLINYQAQEVNTFMFENIVLLIVITRDTLTQLFFSCIF